MGSVLSEHYIDVVVSRCSSCQTNFNINLWPSESDFWMDGFNWFQ